MSETTKNRKKTHRERPDFTDVFTKAQEADIDLLNTNANVIPLASNQSTSASTSQLPTRPTSTISAPPPVSSSPIPPSVPAVRSKPPAVDPAALSKNKTDLELKSLSMETKHPSEKKDLFKAIFDSDDDEETTNEPNSNDNATPQASLPFIPSHEFLPKPATILNVLRNTSPPRGIFSNMFKTTTEIVEKVLEVESSTKVVVEEKISFNVPPPLLYGPTLPVIQSAPDPPVPVPSTSLKEKSRFSDEWIEKSQIVEENVKKRDKKKHKKEKKHKKDKSKKKKKDKYR